ncbi:MAG TPA: pyridoxal-phosphate dependent enzyme [Puia sp.]|nr:pyridoxal-phosphate dependent enzyme [Puia sp.]
MHFAERILHTKTILIDRLDLPECRDKRIEVDVLRLDMIHPVISGNKWFKLKYYLKEAIEKNHKTILSFGGAYSNHIVATACAAKMEGLHSIGIIRGEKPAELSQTLQTAQQYGMEFLFLSRAEYKRKSSADFHALLPDRFQGSYIIPEGGSGILGIKGSEEILSLAGGTRYEHIFCATGTGTTLIGLANASSAQQYISGISVLKGTAGAWQKDIQPLIHPEKRDYCKMYHNYHFGGYAKKAPELIHFMNWLYDQSSIPSDFVYTAKLFYAVIDLVRKNYFATGTKILLIHSGGLQGNLSLAPGTLNF